MTHDLKLAITNEDTDGLTYSMHWSSLKLKHPVIFPSKYHSILMLS